MHVVLSTYHRCIKFPLNGMKVFIPRDNSMLINTLTIVESLVPNDRVAIEATKTLDIYENNLKMVNIGMGEYTLESIFALLVPPHSYGKLSENLKPSSLAMIIYGTFVQCLVSLEY